MQRNQSRLLLPDEWRHHDHSCRHQQKRKQHLARTISQNRLLKDANPCTIIRGGPDSDLLSMTTSSMNQVEYLNNSTIVSADSRGRIGVHRLALGNSGKSYNLLDLPPLQDNPTPLKLFPLSDASSFAVGLPNGDYQIYSGQEGRWTTCPHGIAIRNSSSLSSFYTAYQRSGPYRRYHRDFNWPLWNCSLDDFSSVAITAWSQITNWETKRNLTRPNIFEGLLEGSISNRASTVPYSTPHNVWAFWETGSTLYSAFIDPERDCFSIMDHRVKGPVVCYSKPQSNHDNITSCCFVSDHALATSHHEMVPSSSDFARLHSVRVWDLRKWNKTPVSRTTTTHFLPQFPRDSVACMESAKEWRVSQRDGDGNICVDPSQPPRSWNSLVCNSIVASRDKSTIMITLKSTDPYRGATDLILYDYIRDSVTVQQSLPHDSVVAVTPSLDHVVVAHTEARTRTKISILDTTLRPPQPCPSRKRSAGMDLPRSNTTTTSSSSAVASSSGMLVVGHMSPCLEDNLGLRTRLTSLSWNAEGTSFAGGSVDGDLFVWGGL